MLSSVPVIILAGGMGSRLGEYTERVPKPMVKIQGVPIIERAIASYRANGFRRFIISSGYKSEIIEKHFFGTDGISVVNTGIETQTAGRILGVKKHIKSKVFMACYGDIISDHSHKDLYEASVAQKKSACTVLVTHPIGRFGDVKFDSRGLITEFNEKAVQDKWINGGHFCFKDSIFEYIKSPTDILETDIFKKMIPDSKLYCYSHTGFWHSVDTPKDISELNESRDLPCF